MKDFAPIVLLILAVLLVIFSIFGKGGYAHVQSLHASVKSQRESNFLLAREVNRLREKVIGLQKDDRVLEKAARNELGLARSGELIVFFEEQERTAGGAIQDLP